jgi:phosphoribosylamine--glycine ligase
MNILLLGGGGREHALAWKLKQSISCDTLYISPGNAGTDSVGTNVKLDINNFNTVGTFCIEHDVKMLIVGPEDPLVNGIQDHFKEDKKLAEIIVIGPSAKAAQLEGSKAFAKRFMKKYEIPTAGYKEFTIENFREGLTYIERQTPPIVIKADGLAAGKGVIIAQSHEEAKDAFTDMVQNKKFGTASSKVVIEQFLDGIEMSVFALTDGENYCLLPNAKDYKRIGEGDTGLNTGGMGAISPVPFADDAFMKKVEEKVVKPTIRGIASEKFDYVGFVFFGLIKVDNEPYVIEYNCRLGDPETEVILPRLENDLVGLFELAGNRKIKTASVSIKEEACCTVILVSGGYPESYQKGKVIKGLEEQTKSLIFHAGTKIENKEVVSNGGRVLAISSFGKNVQSALKQSYETANTLCFEEMYYRKDIGYEFA